MRLFNFIFSIIITIFSVIVLAYISMATMIGPWIAPTIVLIAGIFLKYKRHLSPKEKQQDLALIQTVGSVGGIVATSVGFTLPTLYFLDRTQFEILLSQPLYFCSIIGAICLVAGGLGIILGRTFCKKFLVTDKLEFPVSHMIHKTITSQSDGSQTKQLLAGLSFSSIICFLRDGLKIGSYLKIPNIIPAREFFLFPSLLQNKFSLLIMPMLWSIGFISGTAIALPLLVGMISKYLVLSPLNNHSLYIPFKLFPVLDKMQFSMAFCSGLILAGVVPTILKYPKIIWNTIKKSSGYSYAHRFSSLKNIFIKFTHAPLKIVSNFQALIILTLTTILFLYFGFPVISLLLMLPLTIVSAYNISFISGKIGLAQIGRFTTFVMLPTLLLFKLTPLQITILCVFVSVSITVATDLLFDYKIGELCEIEQKKITRYQWLGVIITALTIGACLWLLFNNLQLGSAELFAQRGKARALLIQSLSLNWTVLLLGFFYGLILRKLRINPTMVFGGILMPNSLTIGLVIGALGTLLSKNKKELFPFFSGIFAAESAWMVLRILMGMI